MYIASLNQINMNVFTLFSFLSDSNKLLFDVQPTSAMKHFKMKDIKEISTGNNFEELVKEAIRLRKSVKH